jgi:hypothetical protein
MNSRRLCIVGDVRGPSLYHFGDEAMLETNIFHFLQLFPNMRFAALSRDPIWTVQNYNVDSLPIPKSSPRHASISVFPVMMLNKPAGRGTYLPWHQDPGGVWKVDRDPLVTKWIALDPATRANGCVQVIPGSHRQRIPRAGCRPGASTSQLAPASVRDQSYQLPLASSERLLHRWKDAKRAKGRTFSSRLRRAGRARCRSRIGPLSSWKRTPLRVMFQDAERNALSPLGGHSCTRGHVRGGGALRQVARRGAARDRKRAQNAGDRFKRREA